MYTLLTNAAKDITTWFSIKDIKRITMEKLLAIS